MRRRQKGLHSNYHPCPCQLSYVSSLSGLSVNINNNIIIFVVVWSIWSIWRCNYVTPTSYLELILTFKSLLKGKRDDILNLKTRYEMGLGKLEFASSQANTTLTITMIVVTITIISGDSDAKRADSVEAPTAGDQRWNWEADDQDWTRHHSGGKYNFRKNMCLSWWIFCYRKMVFKRSWSRLQKLDFHFNQILKRRKRVICDYMYHNHHHHQHDNGQKVEAKKEIVACDEALANEAAAAAQAIRWWRHRHRCCRCCHHPLHHD